MDHNTVRREITRIIVGVTVVMVLVFSLSAYITPANAGATFTASLRGVITTLIPRNATITASTNLNKADVERMVKEAKSSASENNRRRETVQARNETDQAIYQAEKSLRDLGEKVFAPDRAKPETQIKILKDTMLGEDTGRIRTQIAELQQAMMTLGQAMYSGAAATEPGDSERPGDYGHTEPHGEDVIEGEYSEM